MKTIFVKGMGETPAKVNRFTGIIKLNPDKWFKIAKPFRKFIIQHEKGHYYLNTSDELLADSFASEHFLGSEKQSLKNSIRALSDVLPFNNPEHKIRLERQIKRALQYSWEHNGNKEAQKLLNQLNKNNMQTQNDKPQATFFDDNSNMGEESLFGLGNKKKKAHKKMLKETLGKGWRSTWRDEKTDNPGIKAGFRAETKAEKIAAKDEALGFIPGTDLGPPGDDGPGETGPGETVPGEAGLLGGNKIIGYVAALMLISALIYMFVSGKFKTGN
jgi:hypothetical protein